MAITRSKIIEEQMFKDREPIQKKFATNWEDEHRLQQSFIKTIQEMQIETTIKFESKEESIVEYKLGKMTID
jgi:hypothetical protein